MKKVLIISYYFPPRTGIGGLRIQGLAKFLPEFGWNPIILTPMLPEPPNPRFRIEQTPYDDVVGSWKKLFWFKHDESIKEQLNKKSKKNRKELLDFLLIHIQEIIAFPDSQKGWYKYAINVGGDLLKREKIDAMISSSKPETCHLIAKELKSRFCIPWLADFRDLWTQNHYYPYTPLRKIIEKRLEERTLLNADGIVTISQPLEKKLGQLQKGKKIYTITNGFDIEEADHSNTVLTKKFTLTYTGNLYQGKRDPSKLFESLRDMILRDEINPHDIEVQFYCPKEWWLEKDIKKYELQNIVKLFGVVPRNVALKKQRESQLLLLLLWDHPDEEGVYTGKLFEYLVARRPILSIGPKKSIIKELLDENDAGIHVTTNDQIEKVIKNFYMEYKLRSYINYIGKSSEICRYSQKEMARKFSLILDNVTSG